jgi:hypothetical protein
LRNFTHKIIAGQQNLLDMTIARDATEISIPESYAVQGLSMSQAPREAVAANTAARTPNAA